MSDEYEGDEDDEEEYPSDDDRDYFDLSGLADYEAGDESDPNYRPSVRFPKFILDAMPDQVRAMQEQILAREAELKMVVQTPIRFWTHITTSRKYGNTSGVKLMYMTVRMRGKSTATVEGFNKLLTILFGGADYGGATGPSWGEDQLRLKFNGPSEDDFDPNYYIKNGYIRMAGITRVRSMEELKTREVSTGRKTVGTKAKLDRGKRYRKNKKEKGEV